MGKVTFTPNVPVQIALKYPQGKLISGRLGEQMLFTMVDGQQMYLPMDVASKISMLEINVNEPFCICKRWSGQKGQPARWDVWLTPQAEKDRAAEENQSAETPLEPWNGNSEIHSTKFGDPGHSQSPESLKTPPETQRAKRIRARTRRTEARKPMEMYLRTEMGSHLRMGTERVTETAELCPNLPQRSGSVGRRSFCPKRRR